jgi:MoxR-like ATPase
VQNIQTDIAEKNIFLQKIRQETQKIIVGQHDLIDKLLLSLLCGGHVLMEGMPGLAKTLAVKTLAQTIDTTFHRIQFTPDLLPADITGTMIFNPAKNDFTIRKGPIFANFILADEINRAPAKVQSALLEAMQEKQVTIGNESIPLASLFLVLATQNPIDQEGTYPLPEAQTDRFLFKIKVNYPSRVEEQTVMRRNLDATWQATTIDKVATAQEILTAQKIVKSIYMDEKIEHYILDIVTATRVGNDTKNIDFQALIAYGASPRASISLAHAAKANAFLQNRGYVVPEDVQAVIYEVLRHRIGLSYEAEADQITTDDIITKILQKTIVP